MRSTLALLLALGACAGGEASPARDSQNAAAPARSIATDSSPAPRTASASAGSTAAAPAAQPAPPTDTVKTPAPADDPMVRGLYVNRYAAQSPTKMRHLIGIADSTEINALVIDVKDEFGLNFVSADPMVQRNAGRGGTVRDLKGLVDTLKAHGILPIARIVVFKDSVAARMNPEHIIRQPDGSPWRDHSGITWVNPFDREIREYDIRVAEEMARLGFPEIQFDYIRFPEPFKSLPKQVFPGATTESKPQALADFLTLACERLHRLHARCSADIFGLVTTVPGALEVGQQWESLAPVTDVLLPMVYPSHYPAGAFGLPHPNADPYTVIHRALTRAHQRDAKLAITAAGHVRPWLQAFSLGSPRYGPAELEAQKRAVYDSGYDGWVLWEPGSRYDIFRPALEKEAVSHRRQAAPADSSATPSTSRPTSPGVV